MRSSGILFVYIMKHTLSLFLTAFIFTLIASAVLLRFTLFGMAFEYDELFTAITTDPSLSLGWIWRHWLVVDVHPPLYNVLLWVYNHFVPYGPELWLRLPSVVFSLGALACAWFLFPKRFGKTARLLFVALLACNMYTILYAQHARAYALMLLFSVPLTFWFLDISRAVWSGETVSRRRWLAFGLVSLGLAWSHYFGALLVGVFYILLFVLAWRYKRNLLPFVLVPAVVGLLFLPWFIPNLQAQFEFRRFEGNWWANDMSMMRAPRALAWFFFFSPVGRWTMGALLVLGACARAWRLRREGDWGPHARELALLGVSALLVVGGAALVSLKAYMFIGRYFTELLPAVYLFCALLLAPLVRKNLLIRAVFVVVVAAEVFMYAMSHRSMLDPRAMPSRLTSEFYRDYFSGREIMVVAMEAFPPEAMPAMYGFYPNKVYGLNAKVTELVSLDEEARDRALEHHHRAFVFMPNCTEKKLYDLSKRWNRFAGVYMRLGGTCILGFSEKGAPPPPGIVLPPAQPVQSE